MRQILVILLLTQSIISGLQIIPFQGAALASLRERLLDDSTTHQQRHELEPFLHWAHRQVPADASVCLLTARQTPRPMWAFFMASALLAPRPVTAVALAADPPHVSAVRLDKGELSTAMATINARYLIVDGIPEPLLPLPPDADITNFNSNSHMYLVAFPLDGDLP